MKNYIILFLIFNISTLLAQNIKTDSLISFDIKEIIILNEYQFENAKEATKYKILEEDLTIIYPLLLIVREDYKRINKELELYEGNREKEFLKWYENYAKENYMHHLAGLNIRQARLFLKMISRELNTTPYALIKQYRNGFTAALWQFTANFYLSNLKAEYVPESNPMIEHLMKKIENQFG